MKNPMKLAAVLALLALVFGTWWYLNFKPQHGGEIASNDAPVILPADLADQKWSPERLSFQEAPQVRTEDGRTITLQILDGYNPYFAFYRYEDYLYSYKKPEYRLDTERGIYIPTNGLGAFEFIQNGDPNSYSVIEIGLSYEFLAKDRNNVYCMGKVLTGADAETFERTPTWPDFEKTPDNLNLVIAEDKNHRYLSNCSEYE